MTESRDAAPVVRAAAGEEEALYSTAVLVDRSARRRFAVRGPKAAEALNGLVSNEVLALPAGRGCYAAALTAKGKIIADVRILARDEDFFIDANAGAGRGWAEMLRKYLNPRMAKWTEVSDSTADFVIAGPHSAGALSDAFGLEESRLRELAPHSHLTVAEPVSALISRTPEIGVDAFDVIADAAISTRSVDLISRAPVSRADVSAWRVAQIAHGLPEWGVDMDETTLAQEASLDAFGAISFDKGCYVGQETVARIHFRGHVNRYLRRARFAAGTPIPTGAELFEGDKSVGELRSSALSARFGGVGIAMVRREVAAAAELSARWDDGAASLRLLPPSE